MRPVERGACPRDAAGDEIGFAEYIHARRHLIERMGEYCSFCELPMAAALAVEHIRCKETNPELECQWTNLLLACPSCNSTKGTKVDTAADVEGYLWPHLHRTFDVFTYAEGGIVRVAELDDPLLAERAKATEALVGLSRRPGAGLTRAQILRGSDSRYRKRSEAWDEAVEARRDLAKDDSPNLRRQILVSARARGFWSVWMTVFRDDEQMQAALCEQFLGTATERVRPVSTPA
jgi:hypothetical protein